MRIVVVMVLNLLFLLSLGNECSPGVRVEMGMGGMIIMSGYIYMYECDVTY